jgi:hypothetical protein
MAVIGQDVSFIVIFFLAMLADNTSCCIMVGGLVTVIW